MASGQKAKDDARKADAIALAKDSGIWKNEAAFKTHCWNVILRVKSPLYPDSIESVLAQPKQYEYANLDADTYQTEKVQWATEVLEQAETGQLPAYLTLYHLFEEKRNGENYKGCYRNIELEREIWNLHLPYTIEGIEKALEYITGNKYELSVEEG